MDEEQNKKISELVASQQQLKNEVLKSRAIFVSLTDKLFQLVILGMLIGVGFYAFEKLTPEKQSSYSEQLLDKALIVLASAVGVQQLTQNRKKVEHINESNTIDTEKL